jgi:hypothetical protein
VFTHPHYAARFGSKMAFDFLGRLLLPHIPDAKHLVSTRGDQH